MSHLKRHIGPFSPSPVVPSQKLNAATYKLQQWKDYHLNYTSTDILHVQFSSVAYIMGD
jgi:hypothetical protein